MNVDANTSPRSFGADFDPFSEAYLADPYPFLTEAREAAPAFYCDAIDHWIVTRYRDIRHIFRTPALFSATNANAPLRPPCLMAAKALEDGGFCAVPTLANVDPPAHTRVRKLANIAFTPKRVAEMEGFVRDLVIRFCTERLREGRADIVRDLAWELPALVLFRILGVPDDEVPRVKTGSWNCILFIYGRPTDVVQMQAAEGMAAFWRYAEGLVESRQKAPLEDFISDLVHAQDADGLGLTLPQAVAIGDVPVPAGAGLLLMLGAANCDPAVFPDPDRLDIRRTNAHEHLSFGSGPHFCLGAPLARLQGRVVLEVVSSRLPGLRLVDGAPLQFAPNVSFRGPLSLPVEWNV